MWTPKSDLIGLDFETYYTGEYSVASMGAWAYTHDPRFVATIVAVDDGVAPFACRPEEFPWETLQGKTLVSHNREFDRYCLEALERSGIAPKISWAAWHCTAALAGFLQVSRDLKGAAKDLLGIEISKEVRARMKGKGPLLPLQEELDYAAQDAVVCRKIWVTFGEKWPPIERELFEATAEMGRHGVAVDLAAIDAGSKKLNEMVADVDRMLPFSPPLSIKAFRAACEARGWDYPKSTCDDDPGFLDWIKRCKHDGGVWVRLMQRRRSLNRTAKVLESMRTRSNSAGRLVYELRYYGADTGRWSGGGGLNLQNLPRGTVEGIDLRSCLVAAPGKILGIIDYGQIEARVILWLAGDYATLRLLSSGLDVYEAHARATMGYNDPRPLKEVDKSLRQLAKARVLGLGFGCGSRKFIEVAKTMAGLDIAFEESQRIVDDYRRSNPCIVRLWSRLEEKARSKVGGDYRLPFPHSKLDPTNARHLIYRDVQLDEDGLTAVVGGIRTKLYGGLISENWTQGTARQIMAEAWIRCRNAGYYPVMSVHDELVFEFDAETAKADLEKVQALMVESPAWAPNLPLTVDGHLAERYEK